MDKAPGQVALAPVLAAALLGFACAPPLLAQDLLLRTPNLEGGWVGPPGVIQTHVVHRFWQTGSGNEAKLVNSPTMLLGVPLPGGFLVAGRFASNSLVARDRFNEWEVAGRWARSVGPFDAALTGAWNTAAGAPDGEFSLVLPGVGLTASREVRLLGALRVHGAPERGPGEGEGPEPPHRWSGGAGVVLPLTPHAALAADLGYARAFGTASRDPPGAGEPSGASAGPGGRSWGAGLHLRIPTTPHTLSLHASNTRTATLRGAATPGRTLWGFEFTVPIHLERYFPGLRRRDRGPATPGAGDPGSDPDGDLAEVVIRMSDLAFHPDTLRIAPGTTVVWENASVLPHTVTADPAQVPDPSTVSLPTGAEPFHSGDVHPGERFRHTFQHPGLYRYLCIPHGVAGMTGVIIVAP
jgi:plastocyanin